jgi:hypothetical protein
MFAGTQREHLRAMRGDLASAHHAALALRWLAMRPSHFQRRQTLSV